MLVNAVVRKADTIRLSVTSRLNICISVSTSTSSGCDQTKKTQASMTCFSLWAGVSPTTDSKHTCRRLLHRLKNLRNGLLSNQRDRGRLVVKQIDLLPTTWEMAQTHNLSNISRAGSCEDCRYSCYWVFACRDFLVFLTSGPWVNIQYRQRGSQPGNSAYVVGALKPAHERGAQP